MATKMEFKKATKSQSRLRLALAGPAGHGKTYSALAIATHLVPGGRVAVIDTERGSASKYSDIFEFDVLELDSFEPTTYVDAILTAEKAGYDVIVIDSLSHAWMGKGGALEKVDIAVKRSSSGNSFTAWREVTPSHNAMVDAIVGSRCHVIATLRAKTEYLTEKNDHGRTTVRKVGLAPVQRDGLEYEFDLWGMLNEENELIVHKTRCSPFAGQVVSKPGEEMARKLRAWLTSGAPAPEQKPHPEPLPQKPEVTQQPQSETTTANYLVYKINKATGKQLLGMAKEVAVQQSAAVHDAYGKRWAEMLRTYDDTTLKTVLQKMEAIPEELRDIEAWEPVRDVLTERGVLPEKTHVDAEDMGAPTLAEEGAST